MVTKEEVINHFVKKGIERQIITNMLKDYKEDEIGIYSLPWELAGERKHMIIEEVVLSVKKSLDSKITHLLKLRAACNDAYTENSFNFSECLVDYIKSGSVDIAVSRERPREGFSLD